MPCLSPFFQLNSRVRYSSRLCLHSLMSLRRGVLILSKLSCRFLISLTTEVNLESTSTSCWVLFSVLTLTFFFFFFFFLLFCCISSSPTSIKSRGILRGLIFALPWILSIALLIWEINSSSVDKSTFNFKGLSSILPICVVAEFIFFWYSFKYSSISSLISDASIPIVSNKLSLACALNLSVNAKSCWPFSISFVNSSP